MGSGARIAGSSSQSVYNCCDLSRIPASRAVGCGRNENLAPLDRNREPVLGGSDHHVYSPRFMGVPAGTVHFVDATTNVDLAVERIPRECHRRVASRRQVVALRRRVVRVEHHPSVVEALAQHRAGRRAAHGPRAH